MNFQQYILSAELRGHVDAASRICICGTSSFATSSQDRTVRFWNPDTSDTRKYSSSNILLGHSSFVGPLAWIPPNQKFPEGGIVSGGMDTLVMVWDLSSGESGFTLRGHQREVTGVVIDNEDIVSSSVDCTLRRWRNGKAVESWQPHNAPITAVIKLPSGVLIIGSSDYTIKLWRGNTCLNTFEGHTGTVRHLAMMHDFGILSASHDCSIRLWALTGEVLLEMVGHTSIVYSVDSHVSGLIVSASEDCTAKIWKDGVCFQSLEHPGSVRDAKFMENGDIITACSDGVVRVWTFYVDKEADPVDFESYGSQLSQNKLSRMRAGTLKLDGLPGLEALLLRGIFDGEIKFVREGDKPVAYAWNQRGQKWDKIEDVVDGRDDGMKGPVLNGIEYDYVFDVHIGDGEPIRKLPYNRSDNPYSTADKWLLQENLPLPYRQQIVELIVRNSGQNTVPFDPSFRHTFTGANAYVPGQSSSMCDHSNIVYTHMDAAAVLTKPSFKHIPKRRMLVFDATQSDEMLERFNEFNTALMSDGENKSLSLSKLEISRVDAVIEILKDRSCYLSSRFADNDIAILLRVVASWPLAMLYPVMHILSITLLHPDGASKILNHINGENDILMEMIKKITANPPFQPNLLIGIRLVTNLFPWPSFHNWLQKHRSEILDFFSSSYSSPSKVLQLGYATMILNYAVLLIERKDLEGQSQVLFLALDIANEENIEVNSKFFAFVAIGSLMHGGLVRKTALDSDIQKIAKLAKSSKDTKIAEVGSDIELLTKQN